MQDEDRAHPPSAGEQRPAREGPPPRSDERQREQRAEQAQVITSMTNSAGFMPTLMPGGRRAVPPSAQLRWTAANASDQAHAAYAPTSARAGIGAGRTFI